MKNTGDLIDERFGIKTSSRVNPLLTELGVAVTRILPGNPRRLAFLFINMGANISYIAPEGNVSATRGILLTAGGGSYAAVYTEDFELVTKEWYGLSAGANNAVYCVEVVMI